ncbi:hypothetical protein SESBI_32673 [Sesbania bispinosa]|nr:hypothetical protein SESBI_32673 [Sesbania bispinosa]
MAMSNDVVMEPKPPDDSSAFEANVSPVVAFEGIVQEVNNSIKDPPQELDHGDWLVVTRSKKNNQHRGKGKAPFKENHSTGDQGSAFKKGVDQNKKVIEKPLGNSQIKKDVIFNSKAIMVEKSLGNIPQLKKDMIFNSSAVASSSKPLSRNKRHRVEEASKFPLETPLTSLVAHKHTSSGKETSKEGFTPFHSLHNIKTSMEVAVLAANRLKFIDKESPSDEHLPPLSESKQDIGTSNVSHFEEDMQDEMSGPQQNGENQHSPG